MVGALAGALGEPPLATLRTRRSSCSAARSTPRRSARPSPPVTPEATALSHPGGIVVRDEAEQPETGGWRTGVRPEVDLSKCVNCLLCWLYCPDSAISLDGRDLRRLRPRATARAASSARGLPDGRDRDGRGATRVTELHRAPGAHRRRGGRAGDAADRPGRRAGLPDHAADADHPGLREVRRRRPRAPARSSTSSPSTRR